MHVSARLYRIIAAGSIVFLGAWASPTLAAPFLQRPIPVEIDNTNANSRAPSTVIDANGNALAVWSKVDASGSDATIFQASRYSAASRRWGAPVRIDAGVSPSAEISGFAGDPSGNAIALYGNLNVTNGDDRSLMVIRYIARANGGSWQKPRRIDVDGIGFSLWERLAVDASGNAVVVWGRILADDPNASGTSIFAARYDAASDTWSRPVNISVNRDANPADEVLDLDVAISPRGTAYVVLSSLAGDLVSRRFNVATGRWEQPVSIPESTQRELRTGTTTAPFAVFPSIGVDARGNAIVAWAAFRSESDPAAGSEIRSNRFDAVAGRWNNAALLASEAGKQDVLSTSPEIAVDARGNAVVSWIDSNTAVGGDLIVANSFSAFSGRWGQPVTFADRSASLAGSAESNSGQSITVDAAGNALLVWSQLIIPSSPDAAFRSNIVASRYVAATRSWSAPLRLNERFTTLDAQAADSIINGRGDAMVVWQQAINRDIPLTSRIFSNPAIGSATGR